MVAIIALILFTPVMALFYWVVRNHPPLKFLLTVFFACALIIAIKMFWETDKHSQFFNSFWNCEVQAKEVSAITIRSSKCLCDTTYTDSLQIAKILSTLCTASKIPFEIAHGGGVKYYELKITKLDHSYIYITLSNQSGKSYTNVNLHAPNSDAWNEKQSTDIGFVLQEIIACEKQDCNE